MSRYSDALRRVVYALEVPLPQLATRAKIGRTTIYEAIHGKTRLRKLAAQSLTTTTLEEIDNQITRREEEIKELRQLGTELRGAYNIEYGGDTDGSDNDRARLARRVAEKPNSHRRQRRERGGGPESLLQ